MAGSTTNINIRIDSELKTQSDVLFVELGMNLFTEFEIFVRQSIRKGGTPFKINLNQPNKETIAKDPSTKGYTNMDELFADLKK